MHDIHTPMNEPASPNEKRVILVIGARGGIGSSLCRRLAKAGVQLVLVGRNAEALTSLGEELDAECLQVDATDFDAVSRAVELTVSTYGRLDGAVNLAGSILLKAAHATSAAEFESVVDTNLRTAFALVRAAAPAIGNSGGGAIVLLSSAAARLGLANQDAIAAAKAAVIGLTLSAASSYAPRKVRINAVAPGLVDTPLASRITGSEASLKASKAMHPLGEIGHADDVASAIAWFLDPAQRWVTGQVLGVDGGLASVRSR
jgi:3-oxoacyl-[acyl-carrier protein] reductase